jgi:hypothetical protein
MCLDCAPRRLYPLLASQTSGKLDVGFVFRISRGAVSPFRGKVHLAIERLHWPFCIMAG